MTMTVPLMDNQARVVITYRDVQTELPDPVYIDASKEQVRGYVTEAIRNGSVPGIAADPRADFSDFEIQLYGPVEGLRAYSVWNVRPKASFGAKL